MTDSSLDDVAQVAASGGSRRQVLQALAAGILGVGGAWRGSASASSRCVQNQLCVRGTHWDAERCRCVRG